ncbi:MAG: hypothetical protein LUC33_03120 [Prevotellaceae bacterium]|nr:hypothetical protein [Prevotellaceae bacterium]
MVYTLSRVTRDARRVLDRNRDDSRVFGQHPVTLETDDAIRAAVVRAARQVEATAPMELLELKSALEEGVSVLWGPEAEGVWGGSIVLPPDFFRLGVLMMSDWERPLRETLETGSDEYKAQWSRFAGLRGTPQRPRAAVAPFAGGLRLEFRSCLSRDAEVERLDYVALPSVDEDGGVEISERCYSAVLYTIAGLVSADAGEADRGKNYLELAKSLLA